MFSAKALRKLHNALVDAKSGYDPAVQDAQAPQMKLLFEQLRSLHERAHADVHTILTAQGEAVDDSGSALALVHKTIISVRSAVTGLDPDALPGFVDGEERIVALYDAAIAESRVSDAGVATLERNRLELRAAIAQMQALATSAKA